jgi:hypothetical protein
MSVTLALADVIALLKSVEVDVKFDIAWLRHRCLRDRAQNE